MLALCGAAIVGFGLLIQYVIDVDHWAYAEWFFISSIFAWNAMVATCCYSRGKLGWIRMIILPTAILAGTAASCLIEPDVWQPILPMLSIQALVVWLVSIAIGFPRWRTAEVHDAIRPRYSIAGMMVLTFGVAGLFVAARVGDLGPIGPLALTVFLSCAVGGWILGCTTFCFDGKGLRRAACLLLPIMCGSIWIFLGLTNLFGGHDEDIQIAVTLPCTQFGIAGFIGYFSFGDEGTDRDQALALARDESSNRQLV